MPFKFPIEFNLGAIKSRLLKQEIKVSVPSRTFLGVDIGTSSLKIVEVSKTGDRIKLENYGEMPAISFFEKPFRSFQKSTLSLASEDIAKAIKGIMEEAKIKTAQTVFSIPDFSTFFTTFEIPAMTSEEMNQAVEYEARQHVPLPLVDITLDWQIISGKPSADNQKGGPMKILLVAVPNEVINQYQQIAQLANLELRAIEAEVFSLARSIAVLEPHPVILLDIGAQTTTVSAVENGIIKLSHSFDMGGGEFTQRLAQSLEVDWLEAEALKKEQGLEHRLGAGNAAPSFAAKPTSRTVLIPLIDLIVDEIEKISMSFKQSENKEVVKIILAGGSSKLPGLLEYIGSQLKEEVVLANPFSDLFYQSILDGTLKEMGPAWSVCVGAAVRGLE